MSNLDELEQTGSQEGTPVDRLVDGFIRFLQETKASLPRQKGTRPGEEPEPEPEIDESILSPSNLPDQLRRPPPVLNHLLGLESGLGPVEAVVNPQEHGPLPQIEGLLQEHLKNSEEVFLDSKCYSPDIDNGLCVTAIRHLRSEWSIQTFLPYKELRILTRFQYSMEETSKEDHTRAQSRVLILQSKFRESSSTLY
jgi:hypothetical protein